MKKIFHYKNGKKKKIYYENLTQARKRLLLVTKQKAKAKNFSYTYKILLILDHIYVNNLMMNSVVSPAVITHSLSEHFRTIVYLKFKTKREDENRPLIRIIKPRLIENFVEDMNSKLQSLETPNFEKLTKVLTDIVNKHFPKTKLSRKQFNFAKKTWITQEILKSIKKQNKLFARYQKTRSDADLKTYKSFRNESTHQKETAKAMFFQKEIGRSKNISSTWKTISKILRKGKHYLLN